MAPATSGLPRSLRRQRMPAAGSPAAAACRLAQRRHASGSAELYCSTRQAPRPGGRLPAVEVDGPAAGYAFEVRAASVAPIERRKPDGFRSSRASIGRRREAIDHTSAADRRAGASSIDAAVRPGSGLSRSRSSGCRPPGSRRRAAARTPARPPLRRYDASRRRTARPLAQVQHQLAARGLPVRCRAEQRLAAMFTDRRDAAALHGITASGDSGPTRTRLVAGHAGRRPTHQRRSCRASLHAVLREYALRSRLGGMRSRRFGPASPVRTPATGFDCGSPRRSRSARRFGAASDDGAQRASSPLVERSDRSRAALGGRAAGRHGGRSVD